MIKLAVGFVLFLSLSALGNNSCLRMKESEILMSVHGANWSNANTTRSPEGGPYKLKEVSCTNGHCNIFEKEKIKMVYEPGHPDADQAGYVKYPDINLEKEISILSQHAQILRMLGPQCPDTHVVDNGTSALIMYEAGNSIKTDVFNFSKNKSLVSWMREYSNGHSQAFNF